jgi:hypothetical protein
MAANRGEDDTIADDGAQDAFADGGMFLHLVEFLDRQFGGLVQDAFRQTHFADVVQLRRQAQAFLIAIIESDILREFQRIFAYAHRMARSVSVACLECAGQAGDG